MIFILIDFKSPEIPGFFVCRRTYSVHFSGESFSSKGFGSGKS